MVAEHCEVGLPELRVLWRHRWAVIWGPPGTGKSYSVGNQVTSILADINAGKGGKDAQERILIVSTTNRALDAVAIELGKAAKKAVPGDLENALLLRVGKGARHTMYANENLLKLLEGSDVQLIKRLEELRNQLDRTVDPNERLKLKRIIEAVRLQMKDAWKVDFLNPQKMVICTTVFASILMLTHDCVVQNLERGHAPFTTVFIDEAGLISRTTCAALSLLGSRRVILSGDSKQLSPISRISRIHPPNRARWIVSSGLSHLDDMPLDALPPNVRFLSEQRRMHPDIGNAISGYMYGKRLTNYPGLEKRPFVLNRDKDLNGTPRTLWYVLDKVFTDKSKYRASKGPGNRSWVRDGTEELLEKLFACPGVSQIKGLFITPFLPQAKRIQRFFAKHGLVDYWSASTVHSQQGQEADMVIFDTVNAGSTGWSHQEWKRLANVAISRAKQMAVLLASREEMMQTYLAPLLPYFQGCIFSDKADTFPYEPIDQHINQSIDQSIDLLSITPSTLVPSMLTPLTVPVSELPISELATHSLGRQIQERKQLRPLLSQEQQRLCNLKVDGLGPRLVRGVAGSGKTLVLAKWVVQCLTARFDEPASTDRLPYWVVYANKTLKSLIEGLVKESWTKENPGRLFPDHRVIKFLHVLEVLNAIEAKLKLRTCPAERFDFDRRSQKLLDLLHQQPLQPYCEALFIDERQDMGDNTLQLLFSLVTNPYNKTSTHKSAYIFYDNAQNLYDRSTPKWIDLGLDLRGRSTIMRESYRSTRQIAEFALNVLYRLKPEEVGADEMELIPKKLIRKTKRNNEEWWRVNFNQVEGQPPEVIVFKNREEEFQHLGQELAKLIIHEKVNPRDICIICNQKDKLKRLWEKHVEIQLPRSVNLKYETDYDGLGDNTILITSPHSFKGFEAEIVFVPAADLFTPTTEVDDADVFANSLYVAMTRARGILKISSCKSDKANGELINTILKNCFATACSPEDDVEMPELETEEDVVDV